MNDFEDHTSDPNGEPQTASPLVFDMTVACQSMELTREEIMVLIPQARIEIHSKTEAVRQALAASDLAGMTLNSHTIKSVAAALGAEATRLAAEELETCARTANSEACPELVASLEREVGRLLRELDRL